MAEGALRDEPPADSTAQALAQAQAVADAASKSSLKAAQEAASAGVAADAPRGDAGEWKQADGVKAKASRDVKQELGAGGAQLPEAPRGPCRATHSARRYIRSLVEDLGELSMQRAEAQAQAQAQLEAED